MRTPLNNKRIKFKNNFSPTTETEIKVKFPDKNYAIAEIKTIPLRKTSPKYEILKSDIAEQFCFVK